MEGFIRQKTKSGEWDIKSRSKIESNIMKDYDARDTVEHRDDRTPRNTMQIQ